MSYESSLCFSFYIILAGKVSIFIISKDKDVVGADELAAYAQIGAKDKDGKLDRSKLGNFATSLGKMAFSLGFQFSTFPYSTHIVWVRWHSLWVFQFSTFPYSTHLVWVRWHSHWVFQFSTFPYSTHLVCVRWHSHWFFNFT